MPTASTTAALAIGDALCMTLLVEKGFKQEDFAKIHPGGKLGKKLMRVDQLMHGGADAPNVRTDTPMRDVIYEMSSKALGMTCVVDGNDRLVGHHHRRRPAAAHDRQPEHSGDARRRRHDQAARSSSTRRRSPRRRCSSWSSARSRRSSSAATDHTVAGVLHLHDLWRTELF